MPVLVSGPETLVNTTTVFHQLLPASTGLADGAWVVTWMSEQQDGSGYGIYHKVYDADGNVLICETLVNTTTVNDQLYPSITALTDGGWVVTWVGFGNSNFGVYQKIYNAHGNVRIDEILVNSTLKSELLDPKIAGLSDGGWVVTWMSLDQDGSSWGIYQKVYDADGNVLIDETLVNTTTAHTQEYPAISALVDGGWVVTWMSLLQDGEDWGIYQKVYDADGNVLIDETLVNTMTEGNQSYPVITGLVDGGWVVTWMSDKQDGSGQGIYQKVYGAAGNVMIDETLVNTTTAGNQQYPTITALADGGWVVTWMSYAQDGSGYGIYQKTFSLEFFDPTGAFNGTLPEGTEDESYTASLASLLEGISDPDGGTLSVSGLTTDHGAVTINGDGTFTVTPDADYNGAVTLTYAVTDDNGGSTSGFTRTFNLVPVPDDPRGPLTGTLPNGTEDTSYTASVASLLENISDPDGGTLTVSDLSVDRGTVTINHDGTFTVTPAAGYNGRVTLTYTVIDDNGGATAGFTRTFNLIAINYAPKTSDPIADTSIGAGKSFSLVIGDGHFADPDGDDLVYSISVNGMPTLPEWMTFDPATGLLSGTPTSADAGLYLIRVTASDGKLSSAASEFTLTVIDTAAPRNLEGTKDDDDLAGGPGNDILIGGDGNDRLSGGKGNDILNGGQGNDRLSGGDGHDVLKGGRGNDRLFGGKGDDILDGGAGNDRLKGGDGADIFVFGKGRDRVLDFNPAEGDIIDLSNARGIKDFTDLVNNHVIDTKAGLKIVDAAGNTLVIKGDIDVDDLSADMFVF